MEKCNIDPSKDLIFNLKVVEACKACKRYGLTGCCPPHIGSFEYYKTLLPSYNKGTLYYKKYIITSKEKWVSLGRESSLDLHKTLIGERQKLIDQGYYFNILLGGGSCKWCSKCSIPCIYPQYRAIPIEATGVDVVSTLKRIGIPIEFPVKSFLYRIGLLLWSTNE